MIDYERHRETQQGLDRQERHLPATRDGAALQKRPELLLRLTDRQLEIIGEVSHAVRLLLPSPAGLALGTQAVVLSSGCGQAAPVQGQIAGL
jgi:hypothetical protein